MKMLVRTIFAILVTVTATAQKSRPPITVDTKVFYMPLLASTQFRVDVQSIEDWYDLTSLVRWIVPDILKILQEEELPFTEISYHNVRLKVVPPKGPPILLEANGNVSGIGRPHRLSVESRKKLIKLIRSAFPEEMQKKDSP